MDSVVVVDLSMCMCAYVWVISSYTKCQFIFHFVPFLFRDTFRNRENKSVKNIAIFHLSYCIWQQIVQFIDWFSTSINSHYRWMCCDIQTSDYNLLRHNRIKLMIILNSMLHRQKKNKNKICWMITVHTSLKIVLTQNWLNENKFS